MSYLEYGLHSVHGLVLDANNNPVNKARVIIEGEGKIVTSTDRCMAAIWFIKKSSDER